MSAPAYWNPAAETIAPAALAHHEHLTKAAFPNDAQQLKVIRADGAASAAGERVPHVQPPAKAGPAVVLSLNPSHLLQAVLGGHLPHCPCRDLNSCASSADGGARVGPERNTTHSTGGL